MQELIEIIQTKKNSLLSNQFKWQCHYLHSAVASVSYHFFDSTLSNILHQRETLLGPLPLWLGSDLQIFSSILRAVSVEISYQRKCQQDNLKVWTIHASPTDIYSSSWFLHASSHPLAFSLAHLPSPVIIASHVLIMNWNLLNNKHEDFLMFSIVFWFHYIYF